MASNWPSSRIEPASKCWIQCLDSYVEHWIFYLFHWKKSFSDDYARKTFQMLTALNEYVLPSGIFTTLISMNLVACYQILCFRTRQQLRKNREFMKWENIYMRLSPRMSFGVMKNSVNDESNSSLPPAHTKTTRTLVDNRQNSETVP